MTGAERTRLALAVDGIQQMAEDSGWVKPGESVLKPKSNEELQYEKDQEFWGEAGRIMDEINHDDCDSDYCPQHGRGDD